MSELRPKQVDAMSTAFVRMGSGRSLVFLHGGPGDSYDYLTGLTKLLPDFESVLYNQVGSNITPDPAQPAVTITDLVSQLEQVRRALGQDQLTLVGHSWGALLALIYGSTFPDHVKCSVLLAPGPVTPVWDAIAYANLLRPLNQLEREALMTAQTLRREAIEAGDWTTHRDIHVEIVTGFYAKAWFYAAEARATFQQQYRETYSHNPIAARQIWRSLDRDQLWRQLPQHTAPALVVYGYQDFEPITQAFALQQHMPNVQLGWLNECGHVPWMEQPSQLQTLMLDFLEG